jgi:hypothetical protein
MSVPDTTVCVETSHTPQRVGRSVAVVGEYHHILFRTACDESTNVIAITNPDVTVEASSGLGMVGNIRRGEKIAGDTCASTQQENCGLFWYG